MLGFAAGVGKNRKTPCWLLKGVYVCECVTVCFWMSLLLSNIFLYIPALLVYNSRGLNQIVMS